ncbi:MAG: DUF5320 domain-containing protein [Methanocellales archaeon]|nr:DUF5320 domain-containing protein [Methanocellales archaeon]
MPIYGRGRGFWGPGFGMGFGFGLGFCRWFPWMPRWWWTGMYGPITPYGYVAAAPTPPTGGYLYDLWGAPIAIPKEQEVAMLEEQARFLEQQLDQIKKRLEELRK